MCALTKKLMIVCALLSVLKGIIDVLPYGDEKEIIELVILLFTVPRVINIHHHSLTRLSLVDIVALRFHHFQHSVCESSLLRCCYHHVVFCEDVQCFYFSFPELMVARYFIHYFLSNESAGFSASDGLFAPTQVGEYCLPPGVLYSPIVVCSMFLKLKKGVGFADDSVFNYQDCKS